MTWKAKLAVVLAPSVIVGALIYGCSSERPRASAGNGTITATGESCNEGDTRVCYGLLGVTDGIKSCFTGEQACAGGRWGSCQAPPGREVEITNTPLSAGGAGLSLANAGQGDQGGGLTPQTHTPPGPDAGCNPCDPTCMGWHDCSEDGGTCTGLYLDASTDANDIATFPGVPPGHVNKMVMDNNCFGASYGHACSHWPHQPGQGAPTQPFSACQGDTRCTGSCCAQFANAEVHPAGHCVGALPDLTIGSGCTLLADGKDYFPVCNRGNAPVLAGTVIGISVNPTAGNLPQTTVTAAGDINPSLTTPAPTQFVGCPPKTATCHLTLTADLNPGQCVKHTCGGIAGTKHIYVNSLMGDGGPATVAECDFDGNLLYGGSPTAPGCSNNWTVIGNPPPCVTLYDPKVLTFAYSASCPPGSAVRWGKLSWDAVVPGTTNILFEVRTRGIQLDGAASPWSPWVSAADTPPDPAICPAGGPLPCPKDFAGALGGASVNPDLELRITLSPSTPVASLAPTLNTWNVTYSCIDNE